MVSLIQCIVLQYLAPYPTAYPTQLSCWRAVLRFIKWAHTLTGKTPLWRGTWLKQAAGLKGFARWDQIGITHLEDVWRVGVMSFQDLKDDYQLASTQFYRCLQLRHALLEHISLHTPLPEFSPLEAKLIMVKMERGAISQIYRSLVVHAPETFSILRQRWET